MKKSRKLKAENITKTFRRFNGDVNLEIDGATWITLHEDNDKEDVQRLLNARNMGTLDYVEIDEDCIIIKLSIDKYKNVDPKVLEAVRDIYRHG